MNAMTGRPEIGQWYAPTDKGEAFQVVGRDDDTRTIEIQTIDGDVDEIDAETWSLLPLQPAAPPEDCFAAWDSADPDDLGYSETAMSEADWSEPLTALRSELESWQDTVPEDERDPLDDGVPAEAYLAEVPAARARIG